MVKLILILFLSTASIMYAFSNDSIHVNGEVFIFKPVDKFEIEKVESFPGGKYVLFVPRNMPEDTAQEAYVLFRIGKENAEYDSKSIFSDLNIIGTYYDNCDSVKIVFQNRTIDSALYFRRRNYYSYLLYDQALTFDCSTERNKVSVFYSEGFNIGNYKNNNAFDSITRPENLFNILSAMKTEPSEDSVDKLYNIPRSKDSIVDLILRDYVTEEKKQLDSYMNDWRNEIKPMEEIEFFFLPEMEKRAYQLIETLYQSLKMNKRIVFFDTVILIELKGSEKDKKAMEIINNTLMDIGKCISDGNTKKQFCDFYDLNSMINCLMPYRPINSQKKLTNNFQRISQMNTFLKNIKPKQKTKFGVFYSSIDREVSKYLRKEYLRDYIPTKCSHWGRKYYVDQSSMTPAVIFLNNYDYAIVGDELYKYTDHGWVLYYYLACFPIECE